MHDACVSGELVGVMVWRSACTWGSMWLGGVRPPGYVLLPGWCTYPSGRPELTTSRASVGSEVILVALAVLGYLLDGGGCLGCRLAPSNHSRVPAE